MGSKRDRSVFGALAVLVPDEIVRSARVPAPGAGPAFSALTLLCHEPGLSIRKLAAGVALSHAGAVRLVDRLVSDGLIERRGHESDGRARSLHLTRAGEKAGTAVLQARDTALVRALSVLSADEVAMLASLSERMLRALLENEQHAYRVCRLCDYSSCRGCPVEDELRSREPARA